MQHLISHYREEDVVYEIQNPNKLHRRTKGFDVGSLQNLVQQGLCTHFVARATNLFTNIGVIF